ncbi:MAG: histidine kinase [Micrococcales bacterium]|nr:histidine kinase [Micrococcales bacterium]
MAPCPIDIPLAPAQAPGWSGPVPTAVPGPESAPAPPRGGAVMPPGGSSFAPITWIATPAHRQSLPQAAPFVGTPTTWDVALPGALPQQSPHGGRDARSDSRGARPRAVLGTVVACLVSAFCTLCATSFAYSAAQDTGRSVVGPYLGLLAAVIIAAGLVWRARYPVAVCLGTALLAFALPLDAFATLLSLTWVIARRPRIDAWVCGAVATLATGVSLARDAVRHGSDQLFSTTDAAGVRTSLEPRGYVVLGVALVAIAVATGLARRYSEQARAAKEATEVQVRASQEQARVADELRTELSRQEERDLIAREMHDTVAHHLSLVSLQAAALEATANRPETDVPAAARSMREAAHSALEEMRALVTSLRDATTATDLGRTPALADLPRLVDDARQAGADVSAMLFVADQQKAPATLTRAVYRIVQESLTNALRHAPGSRVEVDVRAGHGAGVDIAVRNRVTAPLAAVTAGGAGLRGMDERARALGGTFAAGPIDGCFVVRAHLPWEMA